MRTIQNRKALHNYFIEDRLEAGLTLMGWEVKAIRAHGAQIQEAYVIIKDGELFLIGAHFSPLVSASTHVLADPMRTRKLLLHKREIFRLIGKVVRAGYALIPLDMHESKGRFKLMLGLAKGKKQHDKRVTEKEKDWVREKAQIMRFARKQV